MSERPSTFLASAPGKVILFGEHAVVYGRPAIAVPVVHLQAEADVTRADRPLTIRAVDLGRSYRLADAPADDPPAAAVRLTLSHLAEQEPAAVLTIRSTIPIASGLGSGAAVTVAIVRALSGYLLGRPLDDATVSDLAFQVERLHHGTPSGIDNTVVTYAQPVYFVRGRPVPAQTFRIGAPFRLLIADTGIRSPTRSVVGDVRIAWKAETGRYDGLFDRIGEVAECAHDAIQGGRIDELGPLMTRNHALLVALGVSCPELDRLTAAAAAAGAGGAKLSGAGRGGNLIALVEPASEQAVIAALYAAGATRVTGTWIQNP